MVIVKLRESENKLVAVLRFVDRLVMSIIYFESAPDHSFVCMHKALSVLTFAAPSREKKVLRVAALNCTSLLRPPSSSSSPLVLMAAPEPHSENFAAVEAALTQSCQPYQS